MERALNSNTQKAIYIATTQVQGFTVHSLRVMKIESRLGGKDTVAW